MKDIMKSTVNPLYRLVRLNESEIRRGAEYTRAWDAPDGSPNAPEPPPESARLSQGGILLTNSTFSSFGQQQGKVIF